MATEDPSSSAAWGRLVSLTPNVDSIDLKGSQVTLGRSKCDHVFDSTAISGKHCRIYVDKPDTSSAAIMVEDLSTNGTFVNDQAVGKGKTKLLINGCDLRLLPKQRTESISFMFIDVKEDEKIADEGGPQRAYDMREVLGSGTFATVRTGIHKKTGEKFAVKIIDKQKFLKSAKRKDALMDEVKVLQSVSHENVIKIQEIFETEKNLYLILELVTGGELFDRVKTGALEEEVARKIFVQLMNSIDYLHSRGIVHRDLKPENILLKSKEDDTVKLSDFGLSRILDEGVFMKTVCGTPQYVAPEILTSARNLEGYGKAVDLWSAGVILFVLLGGYMPFEEDEKKKITLFEVIKRGIFNFNDKVWNKVSADAKDLIKKLLVVDPTQRYTVQQALQHPWLAGLAGKNAADTTSSSSSSKRSSSSSPSKESPSKKQKVSKDDKAAENDKEDDKTKKEEEAGEKDEEDAEEEKEEEEEEEKPSPKSSKKGKKVATPAKGKASTPKPKAPAKSKSMSSTDDLKEKKTPAKAKPASASNTPAAAAPISSDTRRRTRSQANNTEDGGESPAKRAKR